MDCPGQAVMSVRSEAVQVVILQLHLLQIHTRPVANIYDVTLIFMMRLTVHFILNWEVPPLPQNLVE